VLAHEETHEHARIPQLAKVDEIPFDVERRIMSVVVRTSEGKGPDHLSGRAGGDLLAVCELRARGQAAGESPALPRELC
jgi:magnesium-transporting ATPase (P-type)